MIMTHNLSRKEACAFFNLGRYRFDRLRNMNPLQPIPKKRPTENCVTAQDKELIRIFMKAQAMEPGYPCNHRSVAIYMEDSNVTMTSLHNNYKIECEERQVRLLSLESFRRVVKFILPTLHLGRTRTDVCNACFSLDLQIKDPQTSALLKEELLLAKQMHLQEAIAMRRKIKAIYTSVQEAVGPDDPPLMEEPVLVPPCFSDPYARLNRSFVVADEAGELRQEEEDVPEALDEVMSTDENDNPAEVPTPPTKRKLRVTVQDYGAGIALPRYSASQPNADYYASNLTLNNMNFVNCANGVCDIYYYDERVAGKDGNSVSSLRWNNLCQFIIERKEDLPTAEVKILDNCSGQNKSNTTHKYSMLTSLLIFPDGVTDIYFKVGHSHNTSDLKTAHANKAMGKKNLYTPMMIACEVNKSKGLRGEVIFENDGVFYDWKTFLDKHFPNMDPGFTSFHWFEFKNGIVDYKSLNEDGDVVIVKSRTFCKNPEVTKKAILRELFNLSQTSSPLEIARGKLRLPPLPVKKVSQKKVDNMKTIYPLIPRCYRWFFPEGNTAHDVPHTELRRRAAAEVARRAASDAGGPGQAAAPAGGPGLDVVPAGNPSQGDTPAGDPSRSVALAGGTTQAAAPTAGTTQAAALSEDLDLWSQDAGDPATAADNWDLDDYPEDVESCHDNTGETLDVSDQSGGGIRTVQSSERRGRGRPKTGTNMKNQPAILQFLKPSQKLPQVIARGDVVPDKVVAKRRRVNFIEDSDSDGEGSLEVLDDAEREVLDGGSWKSVDINHNGESLKMRLSKK